MAILQNQDGELELKTEKISNLKTRKKADTKLLAQSIVFSVTSLIGF